MPASEPTPCILVVVADSGVAASLTRELQHSSGRDYTLLKALSARRGLGILERLGSAGRPVALVIAALQLPDMPGRGSAAATRLARPPSTSRTSPAR